MISSSVVGIVRPTNPASMGSSRWPRSIRTAELDAARASVIEQGVQGGTSGAAGVEHVVHQDDVLVLDVELHGALAYLGAMTDGREIVAVEGDVEGANRDFRFLDAAKDFREALGQGNAATS